MKKFEQLRECWEFWYCRRVGLAGIIILVILTVLSIGVYALR